MFYEVSLGGKSRNSTFWPTYLRIPPPSSFNNRASQIPIRTQEYIQFPLEWHSEYLIYCSCCSRCLYWHNRLGFYIVTISLKLQLIFFLASGWVFVIVCVFTLYLFLICLSHHASWSNLSYAPSKNKTKLNLREKSGEKNRRREKFHCGSCSGTVSHTVNVFIHKF